MDKSIPKSRRKPVGSKPSKPPHTRASARLASLVEMGAELRNVVIQIKNMQSYIAVVRRALKEGEGEIDPADVKFAKRTVSDWLSGQVMRALQDVIACGRGG